MKQKKKKIHKNPKIGDSARRCFKFGNRFGKPDLFSTFASYRGSATAYTNTLYVPIEYEQSGKRVKLTIQRHFCAVQIGLQLQMSDSSKLEDGLSRRWSRVSGFPPGDRKEQTKKKKSRLTERIEPVDTYDRARISEDREGVPR